MSVPSTYTEADFEKALVKARQCISQIPCGVVIDTHSMGMTTDVCTSFVHDIRHISGIKGTSRGGGIIRANVESRKIPNTPAWQKFYDDLIDTIAKKCAHRIAAGSTVKVKTS